MNARLLKFSFIIGGITLLTCFTAAHSLMAQETGEQGAVNSAPDAAPAAPAAPEIAAGPSRAPASVVEEAPPPEPTAAEPTANPPEIKAATTSRAPASVKGTSKSSKSKGTKSSGLKSSKSVKGTKTTVAANGQKTIYQYTKYQKFDFEDMDIGTEGSAPGDLSITSRYQKQFQNKLPYRRNFRPEILEAIERIR